MTLKYNDVNLCATWLCLLISNSLKFIIIIFMKKIEIILRRLPLKLCNHFETLKLWIASHEYLYLTLRHTTCCLKAQISYSHQWWHNSKLLKLFFATYHQLFKQIQKTYLHYEHKGNHVFFSHIFTFQFNVRLLCQIHFSKLK